MEPNPSINLRGVEHTPHPANVPGDFYVEEGCCTMCGVPFSDAPDLFGVCQDPKGYPHCYVKRQPESPVELNQMVRAIQRADLQCIRYRGSDLPLQSRLMEIGEGVICDRLPPDLREKSDLHEAERQRGWRESRQDRFTSRVENSAKARPWWRFW